MVHAALRLPTSMAHVRRDVRFVNIYPYPSEAAARRVSDARVASLR